MGTISKNQLDLHELWILGDENGKRLVIRCANRDGDGYSYGYGDGNGRYLHLQTDALAGCVAALEG